MKIVVYRHGSEPVEIEADRVRVFCGLDHFEMRERGSDGPRGGLLVRLEEHDGGLAADLAVFPDGGNAVRLRGGLA